MKRPNNTGVFIIVWDVDTNETNVSYVDALNAYNAGAYLVLEVHSSGRIDFETLMSVFYEGGVPIFLFDTASFTHAGVQIQD